jgi:hypothetical protein
MRGDPSHNLVEIQATTSSSAVKTTYLREIGPPTVTCLAILPVRCVYVWRGEREAILVRVVTPPLPARGGGAAATLIPEFNF